MSPQREFLGDVGVSGTGLGQRVFWLRYIADGSISANTAVMISSTVDGRVKTASGNAHNVGVAMDTVTDGQVVRVAIMGVIQVMFDSSRSATRGNGYPVWLSGKLGTSLSTGSTYRFSSASSMVARALETSASGSDRLVWCLLQVTPAYLLSSPTEGDTIDVGDGAESVGSGDEPAHVDHAHAWRSTVLLATFVLRGTIVAATGNLDQPISGAWTVTKVMTKFKTFGTAITLDLNKNGTTMFTSGKPAPSSTAAQSWTGMTTTALADGDYLGLDVDTATGASANGVITVWAKRA